MKPDRRTKQLTNIEFAPIRYAQENAGEKLHIVADLGGHSVSSMALCGKTATVWRMTFNMPMASLCGNCRRAWNAGRRFEMQVYRTGKNRGLKRKD